MPWWLRWYLAALTIANVFRELFLEKRIVPKHIEQYANSDRGANHFDRVCDLDTFVIINMISRQQALDHRRVDYRIL